MNVQKIIAEAAGYKEPLLNSSAEHRLFIDSNTHHHCMMCGNIVKTGYIDHKNTLFTDKTNSFYSFADTASDFLCSYCYYNYKSYKKAQQKIYVDRFFIQQIDEIDNNKLLSEAATLSLEYLKLSSVLLFKTNELAPSQAKKVETIAKIIEQKRSPKDKLKEIIPLMFNYEASGQLADFLGLKDIAKTYKQLADLSDILILSDGTIKKIDTKNTSINNDLLNILENPPPTPFILLLKEQKGSTFTDNAHVAEATVDKNTIVYAYGTTVYSVSRKKVLEALQEGEAILKRHRKNKTKKQEAVTISDDILYNSSVKYEYSLWFTSKLRENGLFMDEYRRFINKYDRGVRFLAKKVLATYRYRKLQKGE